MHKGFALRSGIVLHLTLLTFASLLAFAPPTYAAKPEDVFKGKIIITAQRIRMVWMMAFPSH